MKKLLNCLSFVSLLFFFSCAEIESESDAIKINQEGIEFMNAGKNELVLQAFLKAVKNPRLSKDSKGTIYRNISLTYNELEKKKKILRCIFLPWLQNATEKTALTTWLI